MLPWRTRINVKASKEVVQRRITGRLQTGLCFKMPFFLWLRCRYTNWQKLRSCHYTQSFKSSDKVALCGCIPAMGVVGVCLQTETLWRLRVWEMKGKYSLCPLGLIFLILEVRCTHSPSTTGVDIRTVRRQMLC